MGGRAALHAGQASPAAWSPGLTFFLPGVQQLRRIDTRTKNRDLLRQMVITRDNVTTMIDAVVYYRVVDPEKATLAVENYEAAVKDRAKVVLRDVVGETRLDELLAHREEVAAKVRAQVETVVVAVGPARGAHRPAGRAAPAADAGGAREGGHRRARPEVRGHQERGRRREREELRRGGGDPARSPGSMELRRFEALANLSQAGNTKVIFDLAKPFDDVRHTAVAMAEAAAERARQGAGVEGRGRAQDRAAARHGGGARGGGDRGGAGGRGHGARRGRRA